MGGECLGNVMCVLVSGLWVSVNFVVWVYCVYTYNDNKLYHHHSMMYSYILLCVMILRCNQNTT